MGWYHCHIRTLEPGFGETDTSMTAPSTFIAAEQLLREHGRRLSKDASLIMTVATGSKGTIRPIVGPEDRRAEAYEPDPQPEPEREFTVTSSIDGAFITAEVVKSKDPCRAVTLHVHKWPVELGPGQRYNVSVQCPPYAPPDPQPEPEHARAVELLREGWLIAGIHCPSPSIGCSCWACRSRDLLRSYDKAHAATEATATTGPEPTPPLGGTELDEAIKRYDELETWRMSKPRSELFKRHWLETKVAALCKTEAFKSNIPELVEELTKLKNAWS